MDETLFWTIIEAGGRNSLADPDLQWSKIDKLLLKLSPQEIEDFQRLFDQKLADAYTWDLWGAAYLINGGCSDDGFEYFRAWLIAQGREIYEAAIANPDTLVAFTDPQRDDYEFENLLGVALVAYEDLTGREMPWVELPRPKTPLGLRWDFEDNEQVAQRLPKLAKVYLV